MYGSKERALASLAHLSMPLVNLSMVLAYLFMALIWVPSPERSMPFRLLQIFVAYFGWWPIISPIFPAILYLIYWERNSWISFHARQAFFYQISVSILLLLPYLKLMYDLAHGETPFLSGVPALIMTTLFFVLPFIVYPIYGGIWTYREKEFKYLLIGKRLKPK